MAKKEKHTEKQEPEVLEATKELEQDTKLNNEMLKLEAEIQRLTTENTTLQEKVKLAQAELVNYRKRKDEETANTIKYANQDLIIDLLVVVDNLERTLENQNVSEEVKKYQDGVRMIYDNIMNTLTEHVDLIECCQEETINEILERYKKYNDHAESYTWKRIYVKG